ncbi:hypothetical protein [Pseudomonas sp. PA-1-3F]|uniref:hypothetical protein n=1 Tax=Pseudomonas sp. PA-1-3F TaxID=2665465 RepID=UPI001F4640E5|nr:hypothetical protein [Pseudomonas sp. PA-1-3F]MCF5686795.1 hypothetical protein [Pseudomonas sp. PA-1-3F]
MSTVQRLAMLVLMATLSTACMPQGPYRVTPDPAPGPDGRITPHKTLDAQKTMQCADSDEKNQNCIYFVEFDEFGNSFSRRQLDSGVNTARDVARSGGNIIVYIHGWHHSSRVDDSDIDNFQNLVTRFGNTKNTPNKTMGIYVAWRGDSIDKQTPLVGWSSYLLTFWDRKATAHNVGNGGGVSELLRKLSNIREMNPDSRLIVIGHSFGGAILYSSISQTLGDQIRRDAYGSESSKATSVADLTLLVNPAFEAMRMKPLFDLARSYEYYSPLRPSLVVVTTTADWATKDAFSWGRNLGTLFQAYPDKYYRALNTTAIGHYEPYITHQLVAATCTSSTLDPLPLEAINKSPKDLCIPGTGADGVSALLVTRCEKAYDCERVIGDKYLARGPIDEGFIPYRFPISNIRTDASVMTGHDDIWNDTMSNFIYQLMLVIVERPMAMPAPIE